MKKSGILIEMLPKFIPYGSINITPVWENI